MMGRVNHEQKQFFYSFRLHEAVPEDHPVREEAIPDARHRFLIRYSHGRESLQYVCFWRIPTRSINVCFWGFPVTPLKTQVFFHNEPPDLRLALQQSRKGPRMRRFQGDRAPTKTRMGELRERLSVDNCEAAGA